MTSSQRRVDARAPAEEGAQHIGERRAPPLARRRRAAAWLVAGTLLAAGCAGSGHAPAERRDCAPADVAAIEALLAAQAQAWTEGDLHAFVAPYAASDRMVFVSSRGDLVRGRAALEARYRKAYQPGATGTLTFDELDFRRIGHDAYVVVGRWHLARPPDDPHGRFTLVLERGADGFEIVHDHSSDSADG